MLTKDMIIICTSFFSFSVTCHSSLIYDIFYHVFIHMYLLSLEESFNKPRYPLNNEINTSRLITGFVLFGERVFQQTIGIPMGTKCGVRVAHIFSFLCCPIMYFYVLSSVLWCPLWFPHKKDVRFACPLVVCRRAHVLFTLCVFVCV